MRIRGVAHEGPTPATDDLDDARLLASAQAGDLDAVGVLYDRHAAVLYRLAACLAGPQAAETVVVEVLVSALTRPGAVSGGRPLPAQLLRLTERACRGR